MEGGEEGGRDGGREGSRDGGREGEMGRREDKSRLVDQEAGNGTHVYTCV